MSTIKDKKTTIGRNVRVDIVDADIEGLLMKVDSGAYSSSVWATNIRVENDVLYFTLLGPASHFYNGKELSTKEFRLVDIENSFGHKQQRYIVLLKVRIAGRVVRSGFTLADRSAKIYSGLIGRRMLTSRFLVDASQGLPLRRGIDVAEGRLLKDDDLDGDESVE